MPSMDTSSTRSSLASTSEPVSVTEFSGALDMSYSSYCSGL
ncbi:hypothetical protein AS9A_4371 [Hoyosella subflava DQS3-9A1]|uniref:Uncharacterized protein n=1 Tax=Hoyosella subflava (strain DSM 45089 / JCM 17490 / NBRC 109087 / DQS3-9A1) TaxID=443218 RepID=F6EM24_HOYSD|nr:hypothetical protein AS9A_4371 [Hoyosella subflava DQS3-9A1]